MSAQRLSDRCAQLGMRVPRAVIANLENGHRESVSLSEVLVIAAALDVSPAELIFPFGERLDAEALPGAHAFVLDAAEWLAGFARLGPDGARLRTRPGEAETAVQIYASYRSVCELLPTRARLDELFSDSYDALDQLSGVPQDRPEIRMAAASVQATRRLRAEMRRRGLPPPPLPPHLADIIEAEGSASDGAH